MWTQSLNKNLIFYVHFWKTIRDNFEHTEKWIWMKWHTCSFNNQLSHCLLLKILKMYKSPYQKRKVLAFRKQGECDMQEKRIPGWWCRSRWRKQSTQIRKGQKALEKTLKKSDRWIFYQIWCAGNYTEKSFKKLLEDVRDFKLQINLSIKKIKQSLNKVYKEKVILHYWVQKSSVFI